MMNKQEWIEASYKIAKERYAQFEVNTDEVIAKLAKIPISMHCWQGDDVVGYEHDAGGASGGILSTGNYPGRARSADELRQDLEKAMSLLPGTKRVNLHAIYLESDKPVDRAEIEPKHFQNWIDWAKSHDLGLDFNPTFFSHPMVDNGFTLASPKKEIRDYWIRHGISCRKIAEEMGKQTGKRCVMNTWIPDGFKDIPVDRAAARAWLKDSLDQMYSIQCDPACMADAVESKLFGVGLESCTVGSNEFYLAYAAQNQKMICLDAGHFHPTEVISDKISSALLFLDEILLHVSRPVRWDSDHVVIFDDELQMIAAEIIRNGVNRVNIGLDYFDATINRLAAWVVGTRNMQKALCKALLEPIDQLRKFEYEGDYTQRLALTEELKNMPWQAVYDYFCLKAGVPCGFDFMPEIKAYENDVQFHRA